MSGVPMSPGGASQNGTLDLPPRRRDERAHTTVSMNTSDARRRLEAIARARALFIALGAGVAALIVTNLAVSGGVVREAAMAIRILPALAIAALTMLLVRRRAGRISELRAALWMEERFPSGYARVTLAEDAEGNHELLTPAQREALRRIPNVVTDPALLRDGFRAVTKRQLMSPALFLAGASIAIVLQLWRPDAAVLGAAAQAGQAASEGTAARVQPMGRWRVRITPPAYSGLEARSLGDANSVRALAGTIVDIDGDGAAPVFSARSFSDSATTGTGARAPDVVSTSDSWRTRVTVPAGALELRGSRGGTTRLLLVDGYADSIPHVTLRRPERDSVLRRASGRIPLEAAAHDDIGLSTASFEMIISSGEGERFTARTVTVGAQRLGGARDRNVTYSLDLVPLSLGPGDVIHLRAVARDGNPAVGREAGSSETRSFRIARQNEYDSVAVEPAPPPAVDSSLLSQRMLLMLTERLEKRRPGLERPTLVSESGRIAKDQARLRQAVGNIVFQRLTGEQGAEHAHTVGDGHDHGIDMVGGKLALPGKDATGTLDEGEDSPIISINRPLLEAYNAMWDAGRALEQADTRGAIPHMRLALAAIERARAASRYYLRGKPPTVIVDIAKVRLAGKDTGTTNGRSARAALPPRDAMRERRLLGAATLLSSDAAAARDSLAVLRLESIGESPVFADALSAALDALSTGRDLTPSIVRARRALGGIVRANGGLWSRPGTQ